MLGRKDIQAATREWLESLNAFLITGDLEAEKRLGATLEILALKSADMFDLALLSSARLALAHVIHLSIAKAFRSASPFMREFAARLVEARRMCLLPPQHELLVRDEFASRRQNAIVTLPTSGGKSLIAEFVIAKALESGPGLAIYVAPYALSAIRWSMG